MARTLSSTGNSGRNGSPDAFHIRTSLPALSKASTREPSGVTATATGASAFTARVDSARPPAPVAAAFAWPSSSAARGTCAFTRFASSTRASSSSSPILPWPQAYSAWL
jgi:hypothetical protein